MKQSTEDKINYLISDEASIFKDRLDAFWGFIALLVIPALSLLIPLFVMENIGVSDLIFPLASVSIAGGFDAYGRYKPKQTGNVKLIFRWVCDGVALVLACAALYCDCICTISVAYGILVLPGVLIMLEALLGVICGKLRPKEEKEQK